MRVGDDLILVSVSSERYLVSMGTGLRADALLRARGEVMLGRKCAYEQAKLIGRCFLKAPASSW